jgi:hypothetical protein
VCWRIGRGCVGGLPDGIIPNFGKFWRVLQWKVLVYFCPFGTFATIWYIFGHLVYFLVIWYIFWLFGVFLPFWYVVARRIWQPWRVGGKWFNDYVTGEEIESARLQ